MKQGIQADFKNINNDIYEYGCYFLDLVRWAEADGEKDFSKEDVLAIYDICKREGYLGAECYVNKAHEVYNVAAMLRSEFPKKYKGVEIIRGAYCLADTYVICNKKPMYTHFTLCYKGEVWDSLPPDRPGVAAYKRDSYRVLI